jgi:hypothetical protein
MTQIKVKVFTFSFYSLSLFLAASSGVVQVEVYIDVLVIQSSCQYMDMHSAVALFKTCEKLFCMKCACI